MITDTELKWRLWTETPEFPKLNDHKKLVAERFLERIAGDDFPLPLYRHQWEAITRVIHYGDEFVEFVEEFRKEIVRLEKKYQNQYERLFN